MAVNVYLPVKIRRSRGSLGHPAHTDGTRRRPNFTGVSVRYTHHDIRLHLERRLYDHVESNGAIDVWVLSEPDSTHFGMGTVYRHRAISAHEVPPEIRDRVEAALVTHMLQMGRVPG